MFGRFRLLYVDTKSRAARDDQKVIFLKINILRGNWSFQFAAMNIYFQFQSRSNLESRGWWLFACSMNCAISSLVVFWSEITTSICRFQKSGFVALQFRISVSIFTIPFFYPRWQCHESADNPLSAASLSYSLGIRSLVLSLLVSLFSLTSRP